MENCKSEAHFFFVKIGVSRLKYNRLATYRLSNELLPM
jgi:hypothetical protein